MKGFFDLGAVRFVKEMVELYFSKHVSRSAAELAYFLILSVFPTLICINAFIGLLHLDINAVMEAAATFVPRESLGVVGEYLRYITYNQTRPLLIAGIFMTLFTASATFRALMNIMDDIYERRSYKGIRQLIASVLFSILFLITIYLSIVVLLTGEWLFHLIEQYLHVNTAYFSWIWDWQWLRFLILFFLVLLFVLLTYRLSAPRGKPRPPILTGGVLAAVALVAASALFSWFIGMSSRYSLVYGSLASVIILLVWLYLCGNILILGNVFNCVWYKHKKMRYLKKLRDYPSE